MSFNTPRVSLLESDLLDGGDEDEIDGNASARLNGQSAAVSNHAFSEEPVSAGPIYVALDINQRITQTPPLGSGRLDSAAKNTDNLLAEFNDLVKNAHGALTEAHSRNSVLQDNPENPKSAREALEAFNKANEAVQLAKGVQRKLTIHLAASVPSSASLFKNRVSANLDNLVEDLNRLNVEINGAVALQRQRQSGAAASGGRGQSSPGSAAAPTYSFNHISAADHSSSILGGSQFETTCPPVSIKVSTDDDRECLHGLRVIQSNIETTQQIFDELGSLVRQQQPGFGTLESAAASTKQFTTDGAREIQKAYRSQRRKKIRTACVLMVVLAIVVYILWRSPKATTSSARKLPQNHSQTGPSPS